MLSPVPAQPANVFDDGIDVFFFLFFRVGIVKAQVTDAPLVLGCDTEIQTDAFGVADVQIAVRLRRKSRYHPSAPFIRF